MPQITVNEIDQSVVTRVVSDNRVKILIPIISSFGPVFDGTANSVITVNDVSDFNRKLGYTPAEFDPFTKDNTVDRSRTYAKELMKRGAAVSVVRVNDSGSTASTNISGTSSESTTDRTSPSLFTIPESVYPSIKGKQFTSGSGTTDIKTVSMTISTTWQATSVASDWTNLIPGTISVTVGDKTCYDSGVITKTSGQSPESKVDLIYNGTVVGFVYFSGTYSWSIDFSSDAGKDFVGKTTVDPPLPAITSCSASAKILDSNDAWKYTFAPQIQGIYAKYFGSFGNNLYISISQITTKNLAESYQYANISVYYVDQEVNYKWDDASNSAVVSSRVVKNVTLLETKRVSTNPNDPFYFEDVEFEFIRIDAAPNARDQLSIIWSNIQASPTTEHQYSGFPEIKLKYQSRDGYTAYNYASCFVGGSDFGYSSDVLQKLRAGFKGYISSSDPASWTNTDVNNYISDVYGSLDGTTNQGILKRVYSNIIDTYDNFTDPYIYDFDFITSGGFTYATYKVIAAEETGGINTVAVLIPYTDSAGNAYYESITPIHQAMLNLVEERQDCVALFDLPKNYDPNLITEYSRMLNTSYGTMHFPWCYVADPDIANHNILMSPSYVFLYTFLSNLDNNVDAQKWFPPAGVKRATARVVKKPYFEMGSVLLNKWQNDTTARVNPIMRLKQYGYVIYGQYTTLEAIDMYTHSALESLNVRLISNVVKKKIFDVCLNLAFEPNTENLWNKFFAQMDEFLRYMKYNEGVYDYRIVMDESTVTTDDINHLRCPGKVYIAPTRTAEFFDIDFIITEAGAQFNN